MLSRFWLACRFFWQKNSEANFQLNFKVLFTNGNTTDLKKYRLENCVRLLDMSIFRDKERLKDRLKGKTPDEIINEFRSDFEKDRSSSFFDRPSSNRTRSSRFGPSVDNFFNRVSFLSFSSRYYLPQLSYQWPTWTSDSWKLCSYQLLVSSVSKVVNFAKHWSVDIFQGQWIFCLFLGFLLKMML